MHSNSWEVMRNKSTNGLDHELLRNPPRGALLVVREDAS
jgi:hypothetical protein